MYYVCIEPVVWLYNVDKWGVYAGICYQRRTPARMVFCCVIIRSKTVRVLIVHTCMLRICNITVFAQCPNGNFLTLSWWLLMMWSHTQTRVYSNSFLKFYRCRHWRIYRFCAIRFYIEVFLQNVLCVIWENSLRNTLCCCSTEVFSQNLCPWHHVI